MNLCILHNSELKIGLHYLKKLRKYNSILKENTQGRTTWVQEVNFIQLKLF